MKRYSDLISGSILSVVGIIMLIETKNIRALRIMEFGPKIMPRIYSITLIGLGGIIAFSGYLNARNTQSSDEEIIQDTANYKKVFMTMALITFYVFGLRYLGFLLTSAVYLFFQVLVLGGAAGKWRLPAYALGSVVTTALIYFLFHGVFEVFLPPGRIW